MAIRTPLYWDGTGLAEMTAAMVTDCVDEMIRQHGLDPAVTLSYVASAGTLASLDDTRLTSGAANTSVSAFPTELQTNEPVELTVTYDHMSDATASVSTPTDTANKAFPVFYNAGTIQSMSLQDMIDTFVDPALARMVTDGYSGLNTDHDGMFFISTSNAAATNDALVDANPVYVNTTADVASFLAANIGTAGTTQDFPTTVDSYYLRKFQTGGGTSSYIGPTAPMQINGSNDLQAYTDAAFGTLLQNIIRHATTNVVGKRLQYTLQTTLAGSAAAMGSGMVDSKLVGGSGNYQTLFVDANDYRAQEFPDGTVTTQTTTYLQAALF